MLYVFNTLIEFYAFQIMPLGTSTYCCRCRTKLSITSCEGCQEKFCNNCFNEHRTALSNEFENLVNFRNQIVEIINRPSSSTTASSDSCFEKINRWETEMQKKIADIAAKARAQAQQCTPQSDRNIRSELDRISSDLQQKQKTNDYLEGDIIQIRRQLQMLNDMVERFNNQIRIDTSNSNKVDWNSLLTVTRDNTNQSDQIPMPTPPPSYSSIFSSHNNGKRFYSS